MRALAEDVKESRLAIGSHLNALCTSSGLFPPSDLSSPFGCLFSEPPFCTSAAPDSVLARPRQYSQGLEQFSHIFSTPGLDSCYVEMCKLLALLIIEPDNRMPVFRSPLMNHLRSLRRWKGSDVAHVAGESIAKLEKHADRVRKMEKEKKKADRQIDAANKHRKKDGPSDSPSTRSPKNVSPQSSKESLGEEAQRHWKAKVWEERSVPPPNPVETEVPDSWGPVVMIDDDPDANYGDPDCM